MKMINYKLIYNEPENIKNDGNIAGALIFFVYLISYVFMYFLYDGDYTFIKELFSINILITLGLSFIFIFIPIYLFVKTIQGYFGYRNNLSKFNNTKNIKFVRLNDDDIELIYNTDEITKINKDDIKRVVFSGIINTINAVSSKGTPRSYTYEDKLEMLFEIDDLKYKIYPKINSTIENDIAYYKKYFEDKLQIVFNTKGGININKLESLDRINKLETINSNDFKENPFNDKYNLLHAILLIAFFIILFLIIDSLIRF